MASIKWASFSIHILKLNKGDINNLNKMDDN